MQRVQPAASVLERPSGARHRLSSSTIAGTRFEAQPGGHGGVELQADARAFDRTATRLRRERPLVIRVSAGPRHRSEMREKLEGTTRRAVGKPRPLAFTCALVAVFALDSGAPLPVTRIPCSSTTFRLGCDCRRRTPIRNSGPGRPSSGRTDHPVVRPQRLPRLAQARRAAPGVAFGTRGRPG
jgi:hypothetical protein